MNTRNFDERSVAHTIKDTTLQVKCGRTTIYAAIKSGHLKARKIGRRTIILDRELQEWLASLPSRKVA